MGKRINLIVTVDWEGLALSMQNLERLAQFKARWQIPIVHYMNPSYFTHPDLCRKIRDLELQNWIKIDDEWGLHLHAPRHLVEAAGLAFRASPQFSRHGEDHFGIWQGQEVMLHTYESWELKKLMEFSIETFKVHGLTRPLSFRAGGWMFSPDQFHCLQEVGIEIDSSSTTADGLNGSCWEGDQLQRYIRLLWQDCTLDSQPYFTQEGIFEIPNNLGAIDYWKDSRKVAKQVAHAAEVFPKTFVLTAHQETAAQCLDRLDRFLESLFLQEVQIEFQTNLSFKRAWGQSQESLQQEAQSTFFSI